MGLEQLSFDIHANPVYRWENFYVSPANSDAVQWIRQWPQWAHRVCWLQGPSHSGKSHLAALWQQESRAEYLNLASMTIEQITQKVMHHPFIIVENIADQNLDQRLLALYNLIQENQGYLLITSQKTPQTMHSSIPDLASRLKSVPMLHLNTPDDELLQALLIKRFADQQLSVPTTVVDYLLKHMERSYGAVENIAHKLDRLSLQHKRNLTLPFVRQILAD